MEFLKDSTITHLDEPYIVTAGAEALPLQRLDVYHLLKEPETPWIIYVHGGAWRDPLMTKSSGNHLLHTLLSKHQSLNGASINYRLSPHPDHSSEAATLVKHPDHLNDVLSALSYLKTTYALKNYLLIGHSAGATLAFQTLLSMIQDEDEGLKAIIGTEGIYDIPDLITEYPAYTEWISSAFGDPTTSAWVDASPVKGGFKGWKGKVVLVQSDEDEYLSWRQTKGMKGVLEGEGVSVKEVKARGKHNEVVVGEELEAVVEGELRELGWGA